MNHVANAKIGVYCRGTKELQERAFLRRQTIPLALNLPKLLPRDPLLDAQASDGLAFPEHPFLND
jgi:hypothetical protein